MHNDNHEGLNHNGLIIAQYKNRDLIVKPVNRPSLIESMTNYIKEKGLDQRGWGTDREIRAFATLCQIDVCTYSDNGFSRAWLKFSPLFCNEHCMPKSDYKIYLFHTEERNHYDRVVPSV